MILWMFLEWNRITGYVPLFSDSCILIIVFVMAIIFKFFSNRFKWAHLNERLAYEKAVHKQRLRTEIAQVKRVANFHIQNAERSQKQKAIEDRKRRQGKEPVEEEGAGDYEITQRDTEEETVAKKRKLDSVEETGKPGKRKKEGLNKKSFFARTSLIKSIFSGGTDDKE